MFNYDVPEPLVDDALPECHSVAYQFDSSGVASHSGAHRHYLIWGPCLAFE